MGKRAISLLVEDDMVAMAKARNINISQLLRSVLDAEIKLKDTAQATNKDELIAKLKGRIGILSSQIEDLSKQIEIKDKKIEELSKENRKSKENYNPLGEYGKDWEYV